MLSAYRAILLGYYSKMFKSGIILLTLHAVTRASTPAPPSLTYLTTLTNALSDLSIQISPTLFGLPIINGTFSGPRLSGNIITF